jgi:hypothetical protein
VTIAARLVDGALHPFDPGKVDAEVVLHQATDEDRGSLGIKRHADALTGQVFRRADEAAVYRNEAMAKYPGGKYRQRHERQFFCRQPADIFGTRHFTGVEFQPVGHPVENLPRIVDGKKIEVDAIRFDVSSVERQHSVVEAAGEGDRQGRHFKRLAQSLRK